MPEGVAGYLFLNMYISRLLLLSILALSSFLVNGQTRRQPKNLKQAIEYLNTDCSDSLKKIILATPDNKLKELSYPWGGEYKTVYNWTSGDTDSKLSKYLISKGIEQHDITVIFAAFKRSLAGEAYDEKLILKPYQYLEQKWDREYKIRFTADSLRGIYIPKDIDDAIAQINSFWPDSTITKVRNWPEKEFTGKLHMGFGMWMRNNWQLWGGSRLSEFFHDLGIHHPDDMSDIILTSYHRILNQKPININDQIDSYKKYWKDSEKEHIQQKKEEFSEYKIGDIVNFTYPEGYVSQNQEDFYDDDICIATGEITDLNEKDFFIKVKLIESCDKKGIIYYDNEDVLIYNKKTEQMERPKKRIIKRLKVGKEMWFEYDDWETR